MTTEITTPEPANDNPLALLGQMDLKAIEPEKLERLLAVQERWEDRNAEREFNVALHEFQADCPAIVKDANAHNSRYATYEHLKKSIRQYMDRHGFSDSYDNEVNDQGQICAVVCRLSHIGGHSRITRFPVTPDTSGSKNHIQAVGSAQSYGRRYALVAALGLVIAEEMDDDGQAAGAGPLIDPEKANELDSLLGELEALEKGAAKRFIGWAGVADVAELPETRAAECERLIKAKIKKLAK